MNCCPPVSETTTTALSALPSTDEVMLASRPLGDGLRQVALSVPAAHCAGCMQTIETALKRLPGVENARVNLSTKRVTVAWRGETPPALCESLAKVGYPPHLFDDQQAEADRTLSELIRAVAVSGFAAGNIMLLSVSVWSGAEGATRDLFHWLSALIALPALFFAGGIYYRSAWRAISHGRMNMDVPIAIGVTLAYVMSLYDTINHGEHAYFDASVSLLFFLLIGRTLDHVMRERARAAVHGLLRLSPRGASVLKDDGRRVYLPIGEIEPGMRVILAAGDRVPVDALVAEGASDLDCAVATGESAPVAVGAGSRVQAGSLNLSGPLTLIATARAADSFLAEMVRLMEVAEGGRARYRRLADRVSQLYAPVVHLTALLTLLAWLAATGDWHRSVGIAIAVLIITCPCALGLAVPIVQVIAARRLFERGIMVKDGSAIERLAEVDAVVFDKTGTLTLGRPRLLDAASIDRKALAIAGVMAASSNHPASRAIAKAAEEQRAVVESSRAPTVTAEQSGLGLEALLDGQAYRLGRSGWALADAHAGDTGTVLSRDGRVVAAFAFEDDLRPDAPAAVAALRRAGLGVSILSGDTPSAVDATAHRLGIGDRAAGLMPGEKVDRLRALHDAGSRVLMVGDGLNDAPALASAYVSMAPASAADIGRNAADFVFLHDSLDAVPTSFAIAREAGRLVRQNFVLAIAYNAVALPIAVAGYVTPLIAALAMSLSSILVVLNALRLRAGDGVKRTRPVPAPVPRAPSASSRLAAAR